MESPPHDVPATQVLVLSTQHLLGGSWYLLTNYQCTYDCTYNHIRAFKRLISRLEVQLELVEKYHEPPSTAHEGIFSRTGPGRILRLEVTMKHTVVVTELDALEALQDAAPAPGA